ncbi:nitrous oxide reductase accessory protein NosL [uncultured Flavobacterium sp.]|uniref:nitrous oxide reductase accessory protein NosL n=1 Tax=uncultured Flavobacterium sp. TaxID=165435 RepID=UPI0030C7D311
MNTSKISLLSKVLLLIASVLFFVSLLFPMWQIELEAPQYPEGLVLKLHAHKIGGDVEIINGLNHYIGMATLHTENFIEFKVLPYIMGFFGVFALAVIFLKSRKGTLILFGTFVLFVILAAVDFYRWNYEYGHNLDPNAAIIVPGMAYQPPLIGYKQLLNFGAYSIPDTGGWLLILAGLLLFAVVFKEFDLMSKFKKKNSLVAIFILTSGFIVSCQNKGVEPIKLNVDQCVFCKMSIADGKFGSEIITNKGRVYKFDDLRCLTSYIEENKTEVKSHFVNQFNADNVLIPAETAFYLKGGDISSPMRGNIAAFSTQEEVDIFKEKLNAESLIWEEIRK